MIQDLNREHCKAVNKRLERKDRLDGFQIIYLSQVPLLDHVKIVADGEA